MLRLVSIDVLSAGLDSLLCPLLVLLVSLFKYWLGGSCVNNHSSRSCGCSKRCIVAPGTALRQCAITEVCPQGRTSAAISNMKSGMPGGISGTHGENTGIVGSRMRGGRDGSIAKHTNLIDKEQGYVATKCVGYWVTVESVSRQYGGRYVL
jgi:hypothetical protein